MRNFYFLVLGLFCGAYVEAQIINIPDANFKSKLLSADSTNDISRDLSGNYFKIDSNSNGEIEVSEALQVGTLKLSNASIVTLTGITEFVNLTYLLCPDNDITSLDIIYPMTNLTFLNCSGNLITELNPSSLVNLEMFACNNNNISELDVATLTNLEYLYCEDNPISALNLSGLTALRNLNFSYTQVSSLDLTDQVNLYEFTGSGCPGLQLTGLGNLANLDDMLAHFSGITSIDLSGMTALTKLSLTDNQLTEIDLSNNLNLDHLWLSNNLLTTLDVRDLTKLEYFSVQNNLLTQIFMKNGANESSYFYGNPTLEFICIDEPEAASVQQMLDVSGFTSCHINSYCSFVPGGTFYEIEGTNTFDSTANGCDGSDPVFPNFRLARNFSENIFCDDTGSYTIPVQSGMHTLAPYFENPTYFTATPAFTVIDFPSQLSPFTQNFCIAPNGIHNDLEITLIPIGPARPGFVSNYKLICKNKGTVAQSGTVDLNFDDALLDFNTATPSVVNQTVNNIEWNIGNLMPLQTAEIQIQFTVGSPMSVPPVNGGDILDFEAIVNGSSSDEFISDNNFSYHQVVVNSFDPNDKTCLEGASITPDMVGKYVHYMIRFENTGTANAQNIVVKDMVDLAKFDISSIIPIDGSHAFQTRFTSANKVEFIFENINLPFDDANNDGYVAFKIKTKPTLVLGNTFSNTASIYFDYNFPIITDPAVTTVAILGNKDFEFSDYFAVYPNPANILLNIQSKQNIEISSISIYNMLGQVVLVIPNAKGISTVDVSTLKSGNYFIKVDSDRGSSNTKFIKN